MNWEEVSAIGQVPAQEDPDAAVSVAWILRSETSHRREWRRIAFAAYRSIGQRRTRNVEQLASTPLRRAPFARERDLLATRPRAHHFRRLISFSVSISRSRSARMRLSFAVTP